MTTTSFVRRLRAFASHPTRRLGLFATLALLGALPWLSSAGAMNAFRDAQVLSLYERDAVRAVTEHGELPLWDPAYCGGIYVLGNPQTRFAAPTFLLSLMLGADRAAPVIAFLLMLLGMEGFYRWARTRTGSALGPLLGAPVFALHGFFGSSYFNGWIQFFGFAVLPWVLFGVRLLARGRVAGVAIAASAFAFLVLFGSTYAIPMALLLATLELVASLAPRVRRRGALVRGASLAVAALGLGLGLAAVRLWPVLETLASTPRVMAGTPGNGLVDVGAALFAWSEPIAGNLGRGGELFVSLAGAAFVLLGVAAGRRAILPFVVVGLATWTAMGYAVAPSAFAALRALPVFSTFRYPERFLLVSVLFSALLGALGTDALVRARRGARPLLVLIPLALALVSTGLEIANLHRSAAGIPYAPPPVPVDQPFQQARGNRWLASHFPAMSRGSIACWEAYPVAMSERLRGDLPEDEYLDDEAAGTVTRLAWSPHRIRLRVALSRPARVLVNQNWHPGFRASVGRVESLDGLLAVRLPAGTHELEVRFRPRSGLGGALVSAASLAAMMLVLLPRRRVMPLRRLVLLSLLVPATMFAATRLGIEEPPMPEPVHRNADRRPVIVPRRPELARPLAIRFAEPVSLEAAEMPNAIDGDRIGAFALYFRVHRGVSRDLGVFVHVEGPNGFFRTADHAVIGASFFFHDAPRDVLLRDAFSLVLDGPRGEYRVFAGLWRPAGDGSRVGILSGGATSARALVGTFTLP